MSNWILIGLMLGSAACGVAIGLNIGMRLCFYLSRNLAALVQNTREIMHEQSIALGIYDEQESDWEENEE